MSIPSNGKELPSVIVDPSLKTEADAVRQDKDKVVEFRTSRSSEPLPPASKPETDVNPAISAAEADRFAESIRPSWEPPMPEQAQGDEKAQAKKTEPAVINTFEALKDDPALAAAGALLPFYKSKQNLLWAGGAVAALGLLVVLWFSMGTGDSRIAASEKTAEPNAASVAAPSNEPNAPTSAPTVKAATEPTASAVAPAGAASAPSATQPAAVARKIRIRVETSPEGAALSLDGASVANPFDIWTEQSGDHKIDARADGYSAISRSITFDKNQIVYLSLPRAKAAPIPRVAPIRRPAVKRTATVQTRSRRATPTRRTTAPKSRGAATRSRGAGFIPDNPY